jgi:peptidoglycan/xylan/chitin deacetylase (PgdA/CDA1 family)
MKNLGVRGTFFLNPTPIIEQWEPGVVFTSSDVNTLVKDGHEIANHTLTHPSLIGLSSSELTRQVVGSKTLLENMTGRSVLTFAYPFGDVDANAYNLVKRYHIGARGVLDASLNTRTSDRYNLNAFTPLQNTPVSAVLSRIDQAASKGQWLILFFHSIGPGTMGMYSYLPQNLTTAINYAKQKTQIITVREGLSGFIN